MGRLLMNSQRPEDIKLDSTNVNEIYCDGILVWKRLSTYTKQETKYLSARSKVTWKGNDMSNEMVSYSHYSSTKTTSSLELDLSNVPKDATITSATLTWDYAFSNISIPTNGNWGTPTTKVYFNESNYTSIYGENSNKTLTCTGSIIPGQVNTLYLYYEQKGRNFSTASNDKNLTGTRECTLSNIKLTIEYKV